ncbi:MAG: hypothetical protein H0T99_05370 [Geodermatophilaceae bacterium]|nr:hypothetical protein [Geodermatophilaceae bacterium]
MVISPSRPAPAAILAPEVAYDAWAPDLQLLLGSEAQGPLRALIETASGELLSYRPPAKRW